MKGINRRVKAAVLALAIVLAALLPLSAAHLSAGESQKASSDIVRYFKTGEASAALLVSSGDEAMLACFGTDASELSKNLEQDGIGHINALVLASAQGQEGILQELLDKGIMVISLYTAGNDAAVALARDTGIPKQDVESLTIGSENVILYPDGEGNLGFLLFNATNSLFAADTFSNMSLLQDHAEIALVKALSMSSDTGIDPSVIESMKPVLCVLTGEVPDDRSLSQLYGTLVADEQPFYQLDQEIVIDPEDYTRVLEGETVRLEIPEPELFIATEEEAQELEALKSIVDTAIHVARGELGVGQERYNNLKQRGLTDEEIDQVQEVVNVIFEKKVGLCEAVFFDAGGYAPNPDYQIFSVNSTIDRPQDPSNPQYDFTGWYTDKECTNLFDFDQTVKDTFTLYAGWEKKGGEEPSTEAVQDDVKVVIMEEETTTKAAEPETTTKAAEPETTTKKAEPETTTKKAEPETTTKKAEPETTTKKAEPETTTMVAEPAPTKAAEPEATTKKAEPETTTKAAEPESTTKKAEPETTTKAAELETTTKAAEAETTAEAAEQEDHTWRINRELFYLWMFLSQEGLMDKAREYLDKYMDTPTPFEEKN